MGHRMPRLCMLLACCLLCLLLACSASAEEAITVCIPAIASGTDCTAVLYNSQGQPIQRLSLEKDVGNAFILELNGLFQTRYTVLVLEKDTELTRYDRSMYTVRVIVFRGADDELQSAVIIERQAQDGTQSGKEGMIRFDNEYLGLPPTLPPTPTPSPTPGIAPSPSVTPTPQPYDKVFTFRKVWSGDHEDSIDWVMYNGDGSVRSKLFNKHEISQTEWRYEAYFQHEVDDCYIIEYVPEGYIVSYVNVGQYAHVTDRCYNGGTIINRKVPQTGDALPVGLHIACIVAAGSALVLLLRAGRRRYDD